MTINTRIWENSLAGLPEDPEAEQFEHYARVLHSKDNIAPAYLANVAVLICTSRPRVPTSAPSPSMAALTAPDRATCAGVPRVVSCCVPRCGAVVFRRAAATSAGLSATAMPVTVGRRLLDDQGFYGRRSAGAGGPAGSRVAGSSGCAWRGRRTCSPAAERAMTYRRRWTSWPRTSRGTSGTRDQLRRPYFPDMRPRLTVAGLLPAGSTTSLSTTPFHWPRWSRPPTRATSAGDPVVGMWRSSRSKCSAPGGGEKENGNA